MRVTCTAYCVTHRTNDTSHTKEILKCRGRLKLEKRSVVLCVLFALVASAGADAAGSEDGEVIEMTDFGMPQFPDLVGAPHLRCVAPVGDVVAAQTSAMSAGRRAAAEVVRLMDVIDEKRCGIDTERATELQSVAKAYQDKLQAIPLQGHVRIRC